ncbi:hypothetical protein HK096_008699, partial [Nowakowskiella sp. JEL0078]
SGESGKSTVVKQMKIIHQNGYTSEELLNYVSIIHKNTVESMQAIVRYARSKQITFGDETIADRIHNRSLKMFTIYGLILLQKR